MALDTLLNHWHQLKLDAARFVTNSFHAWRPCIDTSLRNISYLRPDGTLAETALTDSPPVLTAEWSLEAWNLYDHISLRADVSSLTRPGPVNPRRWIQGGSLHFAKVPCLTLCETHKSDNNSLYIANAARNVAPEPQI